MVRRSLLPLYLSTIFSLIRDLVASSTPHTMLESPSQSSYLHLSTVGYSILLFVSIGICLVGVFSIIEPKTQISLSKDRFTLSSSGVAFISLSLVALISITILLRLGTLRLKKIPLLLQSSNSAHFPQSEILYNHREMDELIFEVCHSPSFSTFLSFPLSLCCC
jgi:hypothetical protein